MKSMFLNTPVLIQLKIPLLGIIIQERQDLPQLSQGEKQWIPSPAMQAPSSATAEPIPMTTETIQYAVIRSQELGWLEIEWITVSPNGVAIVSTLMHVEDIAFVTRVVSVPEKSLIIP